MQATSYFVRRVLENPDREGITKELCERIVRDTYTECLQQPDGRWRYYGLPENYAYYLRVIVTEDGTGLFNAFFDEGYTRQRRNESGD